MVCSSARAWMRLSLDACQSLPSFSPLSIACTAQRRLSAGAAASVTTDLSDILYHRLLQDLQSLLTLTCQGHRCQQMRHGYVCEASGARGFLSYIRFCLPSQGDLLRSDLHLIPSRSCTVVIPCVLGTYAVPFSASTSARAASICCSALSLSKVPTHALSLFEIHSSSCLLFLLNRCLTLCLA